MQYLDIVLQYCKYCTAAPFWFTMMLIKSYMYVHVHLSDPQEEANLTRITELESQLTRANGLVAHLRKSSDEVKVTGYRGGARTREVFLEPFFL